MAIPTAALAAVTLAIATAIFLSSLLRVNVDPREPPVVNPTIPFFGHVIGMLREGPQYLQRISAQCKHPLFTLPMLNGRTYVCTSPALAVAIQRAASELSFDALVVETIPRLSGSSNAHTKRLLNDPTLIQDREGGRSILSKGHDIIKPPLAPHKVGEVALKQSNYLSAFINGIKDGDELDVFAATRREVTAATMHTFYGPNNPFAVHPELLEKYWDWDNGIIPFMVGVLPNLTAGKAKRGMEACVKGWLEYDERGHIKDALPFLQDRKKMHESVGIVGEEHARMEMVITFGFLTNAGISLFWLVNNIFSRPELLAEIREELYTNAYEASGIVSVSKLREACPLLNSVWRETLRVTAPLTSARLVVEDTMFADNYFMRKGSVVQIAGGVIHSDPGIWGPDATSFNSRRFLYTTNGTKTDMDGNVVDSKANTIHPGAFRGFGGGTSLCPGRHFAQAGITGFVAALALGFDMNPVQGASKVDWDPPRNDTKFPLSLIKPLKDVPVTMRRREGWEDVTWTFKA